MSAPEAVRGSSGRSVTVEDSIELPAFCALPGCRTEYRREVAPGRPQLYCSPLCRRRAERERRQARSRLMHFESLVTQARVDLAAYGPSETGDVDVDGDGDVASQRARTVIAQAATALAFLQERRDDLAVVHLQKLYDAVAPLIGNHSPD